MSKIDSEQQYLIDQLQKISKGKSVDTLKILDIGCGYGRNLKLMQERSFQAFGTDINSESIKYLKEMGLNVLTADEVHQSKYHGYFDVLLFSHIIEHFPPEKLVVFINDFVKLLRPNGYIIIFTPLMTSTFYDDIDHIKPYTPNAIMNFFGKGNIQVRFKNHFEVELIELFYRKTAFSFPYIQHGDLFKSYLNRLFKFLFKISCEKFGAYDGWSGVFRLKNDNNVGKY
jgi:SAM-dependent methyltransferase